MSVHFRQKARRAQENQALQAALDANSERRLKGRQQAFASLPDPEKRRQRAHELRAQMIDHLEPALERFLTKVQANGTVVHRAADAAAAVQIVLELAQKSGAKSIAKSKSMLSEEIELNPALEAAGLQVVETDLGEYIIQLRGERPSHIITPAAHLRRAEVAQLFHEKLGMPLTDDIPTMTEAARRALRQVFLEAEVGVSGVNFGVVESGTICILTNEGNGRMVTTLPRVHIALMGMERLVETLDDLGLMLSLLPRSATGQKITVYTSLLHGPRRPADADGPQERHLILVDHGRSDLARRRTAVNPLAIGGDSLQEILYCIRCGACLNICPVFRELGGHAYVGATGCPAPYPGPIGSVLSPALLDRREFGNLARASSLCGACLEVCPVKIDLPRLLLRVRAGSPVTPGEESRPNTPFMMAWGLRIFTWLATSAARFRWIQSLAGWAAGLLPGKNGWMALPAWTGWGLSRDFPKPAARTFRSRWHEKGEKIAPQPGISLHGFPSLPGHPDQRQEPALSKSPLSSVEPSTNLVERFTAELSALGGQVQFCPQAELSQRLLRLLRERGVGRVLAWEAQHLPRGLAEALQAGGIELVHTPQPDLTVGLTGALAGAAETGSLALSGGAGRMLSASLLPELHIVLLSHSRILAEASDLLRLRELREAAAGVLITGPSRTADIEMTLTIGVHGPKELLVMLY